MKRKYLNDIENEILRAVKKCKRALTREEIIERTRNRISKNFVEEVTFSEDSLAIINSIIDDYIENNEFIEVGVGYKHINNTSFHKGIFRLTKKDSAVVSSDIIYIKDGDIVTEKEEYRVDSENFNGAHDGDVVLVEAIETGKKPIYKVDRILKNNLDVLYGEVYKHKNYGYCVKPVMKKYNNIHVTIDSDMASEYMLVEGDRVRVKLNHQDVGDKDYYKVSALTKLTHKDTPGVDVYWEALKKGIDNDFSDESMEQLSRIPGKVRPVDRVGRSDLTEEETITIDPVGCKDMDDAVSCRRLSNGNFLLRTHHVDVDHWIPMNSPIDKDAYRKGNSSYPGYTCLPMLPHELSKGICSLNPGVDRLAVTTSMEVDNNGNVVKYNIFPSVIHSDLKMTYDKANDILKNGTVYPEYEQFKSSLLLMSQLALIFRRKRILEGAIEFDVGDKEEIYDEDGMMIGARMKVNDIAENLIQEFALITNEVCVKHLVRHGINCIYRIHGTPDEEKLTEYIRFLNVNGFRFNLVNARDCIENPRSMQRLVEFSSSCGEFSDVLNSKNIRSMAKAKYYPVNKGHYGLGKPIYGKFTNPAREYTCLVNQRLLKSVICPDYYMTRPTLSKLLEISIHCNKKERDSVELERAVYDMNCASFLQDHKGETMMGSVVDISNSGLKARVDNYMEGYVRFKDQTTSYDEDTFSFYVGDQTYNFGDRLELEILENEDVLPLHHTEDQRIDYDDYVRRNFDKLDNRNTYFKITGRIHEVHKVLKK